MGVKACGGKARDRGGAPLRARLAAPGLVIAALALAAPAHAQDAGGAQAAAPSGPLDAALRALQLKGRTAPAAPFVTQSRPAAPRDFIPVHAAPPPGPVRIKTPAEVAATEAELDAVRVRQQRAAGQAPPPVPLKPAKASKRAGPTLR